MPNAAMDIAQKRVTLIPTDQIRVLNPRVRNRQTFEKMVSSISRVGLKRPIIELLRDQGGLVDVLNLKGSDASHIEATLNGARQAHKCLVSSSEHDRQTAIGPCLERVTLGASQLRITLATSVLLKLCLGEQEGQPAGTSCRLDMDPQKNVEIVITMSIRLRGIEKKLVLKNGTQTSTNAPDHTLIAGIAHARNWLDKLMSGKCQTLRDLARSEGRNERYVSQVLKIAFLGPELVEQVIAGEQPVDLNLEKLRRMSDLPVWWDLQRKMLAPPD